MELKKSILIFVVLFSCLFKNFCYADTDYNPNNFGYQDYSYVFNRYDIDIIVNENNTFYITESITAVFNEPKHGIIRSIPIKNYTKRLNGKSYGSLAKISDLSVNTNYETYVSNGNCNIKIGSPDRVLIGEQSYVIKYTYNLGKLNQDELFYNLINNFDTAIGNITFSITMPKDFDHSKIGFTSGKLGSTTNSNIICNVDGNKIYGRYDGILDKYETLTIRCELPDGYFIGQDIISSWWNYAVYFVPLIALAISVFIYHKYSCGKEIIETVEFYPPDGINSLEAGFLYKGNACSKDVISLLIYLAKCGFIQIEEVHSSSESKGFKITKLKDYDGSNISEKTFFKGLFKDKDEIMLEDLNCEFYETVNKILWLINCSENKKKIFNGFSLLVKLVIGFMIVVSHFLVTYSIVSILNYWENPYLFISLNCTIWGLVLQFVVISDKYSLKKSYRVLLKFGIIMLLGLSVFLWYELFETYKIHLVGCIANLMSLVIMTALLAKIPRRNAYGREILGKLRGFKNFLETCEKEKLELLVSENPTYFYDILPYAYVLGVSDKWIKKFETIVVPPWYVGDDLVFDRFEQYMSLFENTMTSTPYVSLGNSGNGYGFGDSGFGNGDGVGGSGFGGGGGTSW